jgi:hypothetical protein
MVRFTAYSPNACSEFTPVAVKQLIAPLHRRSLPQEATVAFRIRSEVRFAT